MWLVVMFDLPVVEKTERKAATEFRNNLLDQGFAEFRRSFAFGFFHHGQIKHHN